MEPERTHNKRACGFRPGNGRRLASRQRGGGFIGHRRRPSRGIFKLALAGIAIVSVAASLGTPARADFDVRTERLRGLGNRELGILEPYAADGPVGLIEFADSKQGRLPAINLMTLVAAPPGRVLDVVSHPERYPKFLSTLDEVKVIQRGGNVTVYDWRWDMSLFRLQGRNVMRVYSARDASDSRGHRVTIDSQSGDFGTGRIMLRILPRGAASLLVLSMRLDLRRANYIARQAARAARSVNRSANMALGYTMLMNFKRRAEDKPPGARHPASSEPIARPAVDMRRLRSLFDVGDVVLSRMREDQLLQTSVFGRVDFPVGLVREVMVDAKSFGSSLLPGSKAEVVDRRGNVTVFDWDIDIPIIGVSGRMQLTDQNPLLSVQAVDGALAGGRWQFQTDPLGKRSTVVASWAAFDLSNSSWLIEKIVSVDPFLSHGMTAAGEVMLLRALRARARKKANGEPI